MVLGLGIIALITGPLVGGVIPATLALLLARETSRDIRAAKGFLLGERRLRLGVRLAWAGIALVVATLLVAVIAGLLTFARPPGGQDFAPTVN
jgi:hypothetical protein